MILEYYHRNYSPFVIQIENDKEYNLSLHRGTSPFPGGFLFIGEFLVTFADMDNEYFVIAPLSRMYHCFYRKFSMVSQYIRNG
jgi:hypothetical protein